MPGSGQPTSKPLWRTLRGDSVTIVAASEQGLEHDDLRTLAVLTTGLEVHAESRRSLVGLAPAATIDRIFDDLDAAIVDEPEPSKADLLEDPDGSEVPGHHHPDDPR